MTRRAILQHTEKIQVVDQAQTMIISVTAMKTFLMKIFKKMNHCDIQKLRKVVAKRKKYSKKLTTEKIRTPRKLFPKSIETG